MQLCLIFMKIKQQLVPCFDLAKLIWTKYLKLPTIEFYVLDV